MPKTRAVRRRETELDDSPIPSGDSPSRPNNCVAVLPVRRHDSESRATVVGRFRRIVIRHQQSFFAANAATACSRGRQPTERSPTELKPRRRRQRSNVTVLSPLSRLDRLVPRARRLTPAAACFRRFATLPGEAREVSHPHPASEAAVAGRWRLVVALLTSAALLWVSAVAQAQEAAPPKAVMPPGRDVISIAVKHSSLGYTFLGDSGIRYLVAEVELTNLADRPLNVPIAHAELSVDGVAFAPDVNHPRLTGYQFLVDGRPRHFRELETIEDMSLAPGASGTTWLVFTGLPKSTDVPDMELRVEQDRVVHRFNITEAADQALRLKVERIGPREALGLVTIGGKLNSINVGMFVETLDRLAASGVSRIVVAFGPEAQDPDRPLGDWLRQTAEGIQTGLTYAMFPAIVSTIREFHVAAFPGRETDVSAAHVHGSAASAVEEALATAYRGLAPHEIVAQIEQGHPLAQASALVSGGPQLPAEYLPLLLKRADSDDRLIRRGALIALGASGDPEAIRVVAEQAQGQDVHFAQLALECLAASRYTAAHEALSRLLDHPLKVDAATIVQILARYPRPAWADYLAELALAKQSTATPGVRREAVTALGRIGHPQLTEILRQALASDDQALRETAFHLLLTRDDDVSERLALDYALNRLSGGPPSQPMLQLFDRVRDPRMAPLLMPYLDDDQFDRSALITTLARIGPATIEGELARRFDKLKPNEQAVVLSTLTPLRSPLLPGLLERAIASEHDAVFGAAVRSLTLQADVEAVELLADRLGDETNPGRIATLAKALEDVGLPQAGRALEAARSTSTGEKRLAIAQRLQALRLKSPGGQFLQRAMRFVEMENQDKAMEFYSLALKRDPDLAAAYSGRGHCQLKREAYEQAEQDFRRAVEIDPDDGLAVAGLGITLAVSGRVDEAVKTVEDASERFAQDPLFAYNAACVYGRAIEQLPDEPASSEQIERRKQFEEAALERLRASIELGFIDREFMQKDPDLASLQSLEGFRRIVSGEEGTQVPGTQPDDKPVPKSEVPQQTPLPSQPDEH